MGMKRVVPIAVLTLVALGVPALASADATAFVGFSPTVTTRSTTGVSIGLSAIIVGFEFEYAHLDENTVAGAPGLGTGMFNLTVQTPTRLQLYVTAGGGFYKETLNLNGHYNVGDNIGGGIKIPIAGPVRLRVDYRVFMLNNSIITQHVQRVYFGANFAF